MNREKVVIESSVLVALCLVAVGFLTIVVIGFGVQHSREFDRRCAAAGGIPYHGYKSTSICLKRDAFISI